MPVKIDVSALGQTRLQDYAVRFVFGGLITVGAGIVAKEFGPGVGGLFLAFPAIFPASATLIEKHEKERKEKKGLSGTRRGAQAASIDAAGAAMGSVGLIVFALLVWRFLSGHDASIVIASSTGVWLGVSVLLWQLRKRLRIR